MAFPAVVGSKASRRSDRSGWTCTYHKPRVSRKHRSLEAAAHRTIRLRAGKARRPQSRHSRSLPGGPLQSLQLHDKHACRLIEIFYRVLEANRDKMELALTSSDVRRI